MFVSRSVQPHPPTSNKNHHHISHTLTAISSSFIVASDSIDINNITKQDYKKLKQIIENRANGFNVAEAENISVSCSIMIRWVLAIYKNKKRDLRLNWRPRKKRNNNATDRYLLGDAEVSFRARKRTHTLGLTVAEGSINLTKRANKFTLHAG